MNLLRNIGFILIIIGVLLHFSVALVAIGFEEMEWLAIAWMAGIFCSYGLGFLLLLIYVLVDRIQDAQNEKDLYDYHNDTKRSRKGD